MSWIVLVDRFKDAHHYLFDTEDLKTFERHRWEWIGYAIQSKGRGSSSFHRRIMGVKSQLQYVEHINGDLLDNRKANLKVLKRSGGRPVRGKLFNDEGIVICLFLVESH
ncbi:MAG: hypothetical protein AAFX93_08350 [Verrucomicrobiota bacterium]